LCDFSDTRLTKKSHNYGWRLYQQRKILINLKIISVRSTRKIRKNLSRAFLQINLRWVRGSLLLKTVRSSPELNFVVRNRNFLCTKILKMDRRRPAQTGADRCKPAQTGADRCKPAQTGADRRKPAQTGYFQYPRKIQS
jgi:hypothetical protein